MRRAGDAGHRRRCQLGSGAGILPGPRRRRHGDQSRWRWRRPGYAGGKKRGRYPRAVRPLPLRSLVCLWFGHRVCRAPGQPGAPYRGADGGRRPAGGGLGRARLHAATPLSESGGDCAQPGVAARAASRDFASRAKAGGPGALPKPGHFRISGGRRGRRQPKRLCFHRGQSASAGGTHHYRAGNRPGLGGAANTAGQREEPGSAGHQPARSTTQPGLRHPGAGDRRIHRCPRHGSPGPWQLAAF